MAGLGPVEIDVTPAIRRVHMDVVITYSRTARFRMWLGSKLLFLAARVLLCRVDVDFR